MQRSEGGAEKSGMRLSHNKQRHLFQQSRLVRALLEIHHEAITPAIATIAKVVFDGLDKDFYLAGGTALALRLGHRKSVDLDYFIQKEVDTRKLQETLFKVFPSAKVQVTFEEKNTLWCSINSVKVSFISRFDHMLDPVEIADHFRLAGVKDITVMKLSAICGREEYKDYFDLACIAGITDTRSWIEWWHTVYPNVDYTSFVVALAYVDKIPAVPLDIFDTHKHINVPEVISLATKDITDYISNPHQ